MNITQNFRSGRDFRRILKFVWPLILFVAPGFAIAKNLAYEESAPTIHARMTQHSKIMQQNVYEVVKGKVYLAYGYGLASSTMIIGDDGLIIIDVMEDYERGKEVLAEFRKITDKPVKAIVYTHNHIDHVGGVRAFTSAAEVKSGNVKLIAHKALTEAVLNWSGTVAPILSTRSSYFAGVFLERGPEGWVNMGIGPRIFAETTGFLVPNTVFDDALRLTIAGIELELRSVPSETEDEIVVWLPQLKVLQTAEVLQGESFPNLYTIRGTRFRDPVKWYRAVDVLRAYPAEYLVPSHGRPVAGKGAIQDLLTNYRDAVQFVHDQAIRLINKGARPEDLAERIELPPHLAEHPWLGELYGTVKASVRAIYSGYLGWFEGDPWQLNPVPPLPRARRYVAAMGGRAEVLRMAGGAIDAGEYTWAAELLSHLLRIDGEDREARRLKAQALREWGYRQSTSTWRNWALTSALELEGRLPGDRRSLMKSSPDVVDALSSGDMVAKLSTRVAAERCLDIHDTLGVEISDTGESFVLEFRRGVAEFHSTPASAPELGVRLKRRALIDVFVGKAELNALLESGRMQARGLAGRIATLLGCIEPARSAPITLSIPPDLEPL